MGKLKLHNKYAMIRRDLFSIMWLPHVITTVAMVIIRIVEAMAATVLGDFSEHLFVADTGIVQSDLIKICFVFVLTVVLCPLLGYIDDFFTVKFAYKHDSRVFNRFLEKSPEKAAEYDSGEMEYELEDAPNSYRNITARIISTSLSTIFYIVYVTIILFEKNKIISFSYLVLSIIQMSVPVLFSKILADILEHENDYEEENNTAEEQLCSVPHLLAHWGIAAFFWEKRNNTFFSYHLTWGKKAIKLRKLKTQLSSFLSSMSSIVLIVVCAGLISDGICNSGIIATVLLYNKVIQSINDMIDDLIIDIKALSVERNRVLEIYTDSEKNVGNDVDCFDSVSANSLFFSYGENTVLKDLSFSINPGETVAIVGANGSGKSTLCKLLSILVEDKSRRLYVGNQKISSINPPQWRKYLSYSSQSPFVFCDSLRENISLGNEIDSIACNQLIKEFGISYLDEEAELFSDKLSGGEKQKIAIIRAFLKQADLVILDEPGNHLDSESRTALINMIKKCEKTVIIVTHDNELAVCAQKVINI